MVGELKDGEMREYEIHPEDFGLDMMSNRGLKVSNAAESKAMVLAALDNVEGTPREIVMLNAGVALYAANVADSIGDGITRARVGDRERGRKEGARPVRRRPRKRLRRERFGMLRRTFSIGFWRPSARRSRSAQTQRSLAEVRRDAESRRDVRDFVGAIRRQAGARIARQ